MINFIVQTSIDYINILDFFMLGTPQLNDILSDIEKMNFNLLRVNTCKYIKKVVNYYNLLINMKKPMFY